jgi:hypothetical protein
LLPKRERKRERESQEWVGAAAAEGKVNDQ